MDNELTSEKAIEIAEGGDECENCRYTGLCNDAGCELRGREVAEVLLNRLKKFKETDAESIYWRVEHGEKTGKLFELK